jgi:hypothetical protein
MIENDKLRNYQAKPITGTAIALYLEDRKQMCRKKLQRYKFVSVFTAEKSRRRHSSD